MKFNNEWKKHLKNNHADISGKNNPFYGKKHTSETKNKISSSRIGKYTGNENHATRKDWKNKFRNSLMKKYGVDSVLKIPGVKEKWYKNLKKAMKNPITRRKLRENRLKQLKEGDCVPSFNKTACIYFEWLNVYMGWNGIYALNGGEKNVIGYSLDYYEPNLNIVIEWDEPFHYTSEGKLKNKDIIRQNRIIQELKCKFFRIKESNFEIYQIKEI